jgi:hypothetical protein
MRSPAVSKDIIFYPANNLLGIFFKKNRTIFKFVLFLLQKSTIQIITFSLELYDILENFITQTTKYIVVV